MTSKYLALLQRTGEKLCVDPMTWIYSTLDFTGIMVGTFVFELNQVAAAHVADRARDNNLHSGGRWVGWPPNWHSARASPNENAGRRAVGAVI
jgi:hypothetical protein